MVETTRHGHVVHPILRLEKGHPRQRLPDEGFVAIQTTPGDLIIRDWYSLI